MPFTPPDAFTTRPTLEGHFGMAASTHWLATAVSQAVLERGGKDIVEFAVRHVTKGDAIARLRDLRGADAVFFAGDDVTDEDAFRVLDSGDVGVKVGEGDTLAGYRVSDPAALTDVLKQLARLRAVR